MSDVLFFDKDNKPDDDLLAQKIDANFDYWIEIKNHITQQFGNANEEWKFYGKKYGWQLKTLLKKRNLFFLIPYEAYFKIVFVFGDKAVKEIEISDISGKLIESILNARKYGEGRGLAIEVRGAEFISDIKRLIEIKMNN
jgi:hypothetical protein